MAGRPGLLAETAPAATPLPGQTVIGAQPAPASVRQSTQSRCASFCDVPPAQSTRLQRGQHRGSPRSRLYCSLQSRSMPPPCCSPRDTGSPRSVAALAVDTTSQTGGNAVPKSDQEGTKNTERSTGQQDLGTQDHCKLIRDRQSPPLSSRGVRQWLSRSRRKQRGAVLRMSVGKRILRTRVQAQVGPGAVPRVRRVRLRPDGCCTASSACR